MEFKRITVSNDRSSHAEGGSDDGATPLAPSATRAPAGVPNIRPNIRLVSSMPKPASPDHTTPSTTFVERAPRFSLVEPAHLQIGAQILTMQTVDISLGGVKLLTAGAPSVDTGRAAWLSLLGMPKPLPGSIRWSGDGRVGFRFDTDLTPDVLDCIRINPSLQVRRAYLTGRLISV